jgi:hypothetical protein
VPRVTPKSRGVPFFSERCGDLLTGSYDRADRIVLNAYFRMGMRRAAFACGEAAREGIEYLPLDNGFRACDQPERLAEGVEPVIQAHYKHSKVKQYFKEGRALRTETTVNDPYDFGVKRTLTADTWRQLRSIGDDINDRLLDAQLQACSCAPDPETLTRLVSPSIEDGLPAPALHFGDPRVMALLACLCSFQHLFAGLTNPRGVT